MRRTVAVSYRVAGALAAAPLPTRAVFQCLRIILTKRRVDLDVGVSLVDPWPSPLWHRRRVDRAGLLLSQHGWYEKGLVHSCRRGLPRWREEERQRRVLLGRGLAGTLLVEY